MTQSSPELPTPGAPGPFGHKLRKSFLFPENFTQFNHGSFGTFPKVVQDAMIAYHQHAEKDPDRWMRRELKPALTKIREELAELIHCDKDDLALVTNTTAGVNTILRSLQFQPGDRILQLSTGYISVEKTVRYISDSHDDVKVIDVPITFPLTGQEILHKVEQAILAHKQLNDGSRIRLAMVDWISSVPSILHPVKPLVELLQSHGILVFVDGAHSIGQVHVDLNDLHPDFYITNCHKWLFSVRGSAVLYVPRRHQHLIHPTSITADYKTGFEAEFSWAGTQDYSSLMSISSAIAFRKQFGEDAIIGYTHALAIQGGKIVADILGSNSLTPDDHQVANMVNIRLPLNNVDHPKATVQYFMDTLMDRYNIYTPTFKHGGQWWTRVSAQIYLELDDFVRLGNIWKEVIDELNTE
ncbi:hypothetical protein BX616_004411 [Lobosporangium transversale]|uniref:Putative cysteine desulfurylase n=1 Tax=Lobosporangium transversale TaxID=64571 RepID=A0A1Y2GNG7_9FUNG|nr:putative cysteine desulfurylase [Lobosporangium transversale]KAF9918902.1 hypothetical protein BX616_004411 [Lobosporangium transversale]ORZ16176.1 putative cysteine desulfurylase [Lobosporangium transversale]|eukprot:XP_021881523.1 putative cysteine desulfurylase [Lobosporangium transversale]